MSDPEYIKGLYLLIDDGNEVVWYDGEKWWVPGWECGMDLSDHAGSFSIDRKTIGRLVWSPLTDPLCNP